MSQAKKPRQTDPTVAASDEAQAGTLMVHEQLLDAFTPGFQAEFDPEEADRVGAFTEDALDEKDALASSDDLRDAQA